MYTSSSSSSASQRSTPSTGGGGLIRYGSAPGSFLTRTVDSVIGSAQTLMGPQHPAAHHYFSGDSSSDTKDPKSSTTNTASATTGLQRSYGLNELTVGDFPTTSNLKIGVGGGSSSCSSSSSSSSSSPSLVRHSSSPAGFLNHLTCENAFSVTRGTGSFNSRGGFNGGHGVSRLKPQLSFTRQDSSLSQISEVSEDVVDGLNSNNGQHHRDNAATHSYGNAGFGMDSWDNNPNTIVFSNPPNKRSKNNINGDFMNCLVDGLGLESQYSMPQTSLEMATVENLLQIPEDSVTCKIRAKRGCATHPRSIAERERRTRISGKLKKLQDLVPNMDKQTSYSDMLDLAVQHIKGLQNEVQKLHKDLESCNCGCKNSS